MRAFMCPTCSAFSLMIVYLLRKVRNQALETHIPKNGFKHNYIEKLASGSMFSEGSIPQDDC